MKAGTRVKHRNYGPGEVRQLRKAGREAYVHFDVGVVLHCPVGELEPLEASHEKKTSSPHCEQLHTPNAVLQGSPPLPVTLSQYANEHKSHSELSSQEAENLTAGDGVRPHVLDTSLLNSVRSSDDSEEAIIAKHAIMEALLGNAQSDADYVRAKASATSEPDIQNAYGRPPIFYDEVNIARQVIEALRFGVVPRFYVDEFTVGMRHERAIIRRALQTAQSVGGDVCAIVGEYGVGKSHLFEWTAIEAMKEGYIVGSISLDNAEVPPNQPHRIYNALLNSLRYPERSDLSSLGPLFDKFIDQAAFAHTGAEMRSKHRLCPLLNSLTAFRRARKRGAHEDVDIILQWISGEPLLKRVIQEAAQDDVILLRPWSTAADQYCYLLSGIAWLARQAGYKGLVVLVDEAEHYSLLPQYKKVRADLFFQGMIYSALGKRQTRIKGCQDNHRPFGCGLAHNTVHPYPFSYSPEQTGLLFMFAATTSADSFDYGSWLEEEQVVLLQKRISEGELEKLLARVYVSHSKAYGYDRKEDFLDASFRLITLYESGILNLRALIRYSTEVFDLLSQYPDYSSSELLADLNRAFS